MNKRELGVIVCRLQAPALTEAHQYLFRQTGTRVERILVLLGCPPVPLLKHDPLEFALRAHMVREWAAVEFPQKEIIVLPLYDCPTDAEWVSRIDQAVGAVNINAGATLYCGPDGAGPCYKAAGGKWPVEMLDSMGGHASRIRYELGPRNTEDFRAGVIYATERRFNNPFPVIDVVIRQGNQVLLGHKQMDRREDGREWRFIGGFVDATDGSLEATVRREVREETGLEVAEPMYVGSAQVDDWRFRSGPEAVLTSVFSCEKVSGTEKAADDIDKLRWFHKDEVSGVLHPIHAPLWELGLRVQ